MGRLDKNNRKFLAEILYGFIKRDYVKVAEVHFLAALVPKDASKEEFAQVLRSKRTYFWTIYQRHFWWKFIGSII